MRARPLCWRSRRIPARWPGCSGRLPPTCKPGALDVALETAARWNAYVILKGFHTILALPDGRAFVNTTGNPGMATGGTGDVLTGMLAGLTAEFGTEHWERVLGLGIYLHGLAGDLAAARVGEIAAGGLRSDRSVARGFCATLGGVRLCRTLKNSSLIPLKKPSRSAASWHGA